MLLLIISGLLVVATLAGLKCRGWGSGASLLTLSLLRFHAALLTPTRRPALGLLNTDSEVSVLLLIVIGFLVVATLAGLTCQGRGVELLLLHCPSSGTLVLALFFVHWNSWGLLMRLSSSCPPLSLFGGR